MWLLRFNCFWKCLHISTILSCLNSMYVFWSGTSFVPHVPKMILFPCVCQIFTRYGKCYTFNSGQDGRPLLVTMKGGMGNGLELMLDIQQDEYLPVWGETGELLKAKKKTYKSLLCFVLKWSVTSFIFTVGLKANPLFSTLPVFCIICTTNCIYYSHFGRFYVVVNPCCVANTCTGDQSECICTNFFQDKRAFAKVGSPKHLFADWKLATWNRQIAITLENLDFIAL